MGRVAVALSLDAALQAAVPASWRQESRPLPETARVEVHLVATDDPPGLDDAHGFRDSQFAGGGCRLSRARVTRDFERVEGECVAHPAALARAVRFATEPLLAAHGWLLLHASSVVVGGGAHLFAAPSGTGKSTLARTLVAAGAELLGDEVACVGPEGVAVHPGQAPHGALGKVVPLSTIHLLGRGEPGTQPAGVAEATAELLSQAMVYEDDRAALDRAMAQVADLVSRTPVVRTRVPLGIGALSLFGFGAGGR